MAQSQDDRKAALIAKIADRIRGGGAVTQAFAQAYFARVAYADLAARDPDDLAAQARSLATFAAHRAPGRPLVRVFNPERDDHGWSHAHTVVEIVNDNMPFLVDSTIMALNARGLVAHLVIHPIVRVWRGAGGALKGIATEADAPKGTRAVAESFIHVETDRQAVGRELVEIRRAVVSVLRDVRRAVRDWQRMRARLNELIAGLDASLPAAAAGDPTASQDIGEAHDFLEWLDDDHFTFLGYRRYDFVERADGVRAEPVSRSGLGVLRDTSVRVFYADDSPLPRDVTGLIESGDVITVTKANRRSTVHRPAHLDTIGVRILDKRGHTAGEHRFVGLFTSRAYSVSPCFVPLLRRKIARCIEHAHFDPASHDGKALLHILDTYPRDELFQIPEDELLETALGILQLQDRQRTALFARCDPFGRFVSCLVFTPKEVYSSSLRERFSDILCRAFSGTLSAFYPQIGDEALARIHFIIRTDPARRTEYDHDSAEAELAAAARSWIDELRDSLIAAHGEGQGLALAARYRDAFPAAYRDAFGGAEAVTDAGRVERVLAGGDPALDLYRRAGAAPGALRLKIYHPCAPLPLSDVLPVLENMGLRVIEEIPFRVDAHDAAPVWIHDFGLECRCGDLVENDFARVKALFEAALDAVRTGALENDGYNRLVLAEGLDWREVGVVRAYSKYLRQVRVPFSQDYMMETFARNPGFARRLVDLFAARLDPAARKGANARIATLKVRYEEALDAVANLDEDRILRRFLNVVLATLRTNRYRKEGEDGAPRPPLALKLASGDIEGLPQPRPWREIWVYSPRVEGIHLRGGPVARGGIRWSDRREDFRTEVLGLMKAQTVKNPVIVPVGAKGGFVVKRPPDDPGREAQQAEGIACYKAFVGALLDVTDNREGARVVPPGDVIRHDDDDPYLVVAADKGTATFSDIANGIARERGFWLDDAFASGGSVGYDHKKMGITARGAWEAVKRHFREIGKDIQSRDFTCVGVGDMAGDVFGNGMLLSPHIKLVAAFNHVHVFLDPDPDPEASLAERRRLFETPRSGWMDYDRALLSKGGGVFERRAKSIPLSAEVKALLGVTASALPPDDLIRRILAAEVELLWFGGIGTFVKSARQSHADVGDRANDALRVDAQDLRCKVVGEGANLAMTQLARIEYARAGGRLNTDAIDNSAGVDTSDHEVNIKILLRQAVQAKKLSMKARDRLLAGMTDEVARLVLRDNYLQTQALSVAEAEAADRLSNAHRLTRALERAGRVSRTLDGLPDEDAFAELGRAGQGLTRPEMAVLLAHAKLALNDDLIGTALPDEPLLERDLADYFPAPIRKRFGKEIPKHLLRREIIVTAVANEVVNRAGPTFVNDMHERTGRDAEAVARAYEIVRHAFGCDDMWRGIEALDNKAPAACQTDMLREIKRLIERAGVWLLNHGDHPLDIEANVAALAPCIAALARALPDVIPEDARAALAERAAALAGSGVPDTLARRIAGLQPMNAALDVIRLARHDDRTVPEMAGVYFDVGGRFGFDWLRAAARRVEAQTHWQRQAAQSMIDELYVLQHDLVAGIAAAAGEAKTVSAIVPVWAEARKARVTRAAQTLADIQAAGAVDLAMIAVAVRQLRVLAADRAG